MEVVFKAKMHGQLDMYLKGILKVHNEQLERYRVAYNIVCTKF